MDKGLKMKQTREETQRGVDQIYIQLKEVLEYANGQPLDSEREEIRAELEELLEIVNTDPEYKEGISRLNDEAYIEYEKMLTSLFFKLTDGKSLQNFFDNRIIDNPVFKKLTPIHTENGEESYQKLNVDDSSDEDAVQNTKNVKKHNLLGGELSKLDELDSSGVLECFYFYNNFILYQYDSIQNYQRPKFTPTRPKVLTDSDMFFQLPYSLQSNFIRNRWELGEKKGGEAKGKIAAYLRSLRNSMKLEDLFRTDGPFMNIQLREFLNINMEGEDRYTWQEVHEGNSGWSEMSSFGSRYHQSKADRNKCSIIFGYYFSGGYTNYTRPIYRSYYNRLNAKFTNTDGREAVFAFPGEGKYIYCGPDRGTYNYINALPNLHGHTKYDVEPFEKNPPSGYDKDTLQLYNDLQEENSFFWKYK